MYYTHVITMVNVNYNVHYKHCYNDYYECIAEGARV